MEWIFTQTGKKGSDEGREQSTGIFRKKSLIVPNPSKQRRPGENAHWTGLLDGKSTLVRAFDKHTV